MAPDESNATETDTVVEAVRKRPGTEPGTLAEFEAEYGAITPPDGDQGLRCGATGPYGSAG